MEDVLKKIYEDKILLEEEKEKAERYTAEVENLQKELSQKKLDFTLEQEECIQSAKREAMLLLEAAKKNQQFICWFQILQIKFKTCVLEAGMSKGIVLNFSIITRGYAPFRGCKKRGKPDYC